MARSISKDVAVARGVYLAANGAWGIRFNTEAFAAAAAVLKPEQEIRPTVEVTRYWRMYNLPRGCDKRAIERFIDEAKWKAVVFAPLRSPSRSPS